MDSYGTDLQICDVHKRFGENRALDGVGLEARPGQFLAIVGRSGCGKSTLLRLIAGLDTPTEGAICVERKLLRGLNTGARMMFQDARLLPWKRVLQNVGLGLKAEERDRAEWALRQVGLLDRARDWPAILSGGQKQRVALARALAGRPRLLLLDEPLGALDALTRIEMQQLIETLWLEQRFTSLLVTHDVEEAVALADQIVVMEAGRVVYETAVPLPRPRPRASLAFAEIKDAVLHRVLNKDSDLALLTR